MRDDWPYETAGLDQVCPWQELPFEWLEKYDSLPNFANATSLKYYAPAYMRWILLDSGSSRTVGAEKFVTRLYHCAKEFLGRKETGASFVRDLSSEQRHAITQFLEWLAWTTSTEVLYSDGGRAYASWRTLESQC
jgi:hypothetical protein